jgi:signal transduction histidine kinase
MSDRPRILHVDDFYENRALVARILDSHGYEVVEAEDAREGIAKAVEQTPDLILMDINLPDIDGFSAVTKLRSNPDLSQLPIIALTARDVPDDRERALAVGCDGYLNKPVQVNKLLSVIAEHLLSRHKEAPPTAREHYLREQNVGLVEELERKLDELTAAFERLQRLDEAKTGFIFLASHELRTPLTLVQGYTDILSAHPLIRDDEMLLELVEGCKQGTDRLRAIVGDIIDLVRAQQKAADPNFRPLRLEPVIETAVAALNLGSSGRELDLRVDVPQDLPPVSGDEAQLGQVFERLIGNAIKYTPEGGCISVTARAYTEKMHGEVKWPFIKIGIRDTGIGIDQEQQRLIFEKFYTAEDTRHHSSSKTQFMGGGPGLGLTIAQGFVENHGGRIWVESDGYDPENLPGSTFFILLPALPGRAE